MTTRMRRILLITQKVRYNLAVRASTILRGLSACSANLFSWQWPDASNAVFHLSKLCNVHIIVFRMRANILIRNRFSVEHAQHILIACGLYAFLRPYISETYSVIFLSCGVYRNGRCHYGSGSDLSCGHKVRHAHIPLPQFFLAVYTRVNLLFL